MTTDQENLRWIFLQLQVSYLQIEDHKKRLERILEKFPDEIKGKKVEEK
ncbi:MAG: hypothetical protein V1751_08350 [Pseudomonadota bacterium]